MHRATQSADLQKVMQQRPVQVIAVTSGKGGVGKTNVAANIAVALGAGNRNVLLLDADLGLANVDVLLGLQPRFNLSHFIGGDVDLSSTILRGPNGIRVVPAASGNRCMTDLPVAAQAEIIRAFGGLSNQPDILVVDTAAGIAENVARFVQAAQQAIVVVCDEPASITDAYALLKVFSRDYGISHFQIVTNQTCTPLAGSKLFGKIRKVADLYLDVVLRHLGDVPQDDLLRRAVQEQRAVVEAYPHSASGGAFLKIAESINRLPNTNGASGNIEFFFERLLAVGRPEAGRVA